MLNLILHAVLHFIGLALGALYARAAYRRKLREYLDRGIVQWRTQRDLTSKAETKQVANYYVDAYQSVRTSMLGETLPWDGS